MATVDREHREQRLGDARRLRKILADIHTLRRYKKHAKNDDERRFDFNPGMAAFTKGLPHDNDGVPNGPEYDDLVLALLGDEVHGQDGYSGTVLGGSGDFSEMNLGGDRKLVNPEAAFSFNATGRDPHDIFIPAAPGIESDQTAAEMIEVYWQALCRDIKFREYETQSNVFSLIKGAVAELTPLVEDDENPFEAPVTERTIFRGSLNGCLEGPYISQFLYRDVPNGVFDHKQMFQPFKDGTDYMTSESDWLNVQNGGFPTGFDNVPSNNKIHDVESNTNSERYIITGRDLATYVRIDPPQLAYLNAALFLAGKVREDEDGNPAIDDNGNEIIGAPLDPGNPFSETENTDSFVDYGHNNAQAMVAGITNDAFHGAWCHKWGVHRRPRPEALSGLIHHEEEGNIDIYDIPEPLDDSIDQPLDLDDFPGQDRVLARIKNNHGTYLLPQAYPEGSPTHPSYPAGHATNAGACVTILKAFYDESYKFNAMVPNADGMDLEPLDDGGEQVRLAVGNELNKLAANIAIGRDWAGVHYRTDATAGFELGEKIAISALVDHLRMKGTYGQLQLERFNGNKVMITSNGID